MLYQVEVTSRSHNGMKTRYYVAKKSEWNRNMLTSLRLFVGMFTMDELPDVIKRAWALDREVISVEIVLANT